MLEDPQIEFAIIATPNDTHFEIAKRLLEAGKHGINMPLPRKILLTSLDVVLVDKPITTIYSQAVELERISQSKNLVLYAHQNRRWDSDFLALRDLLALPPTHPNSLGTLYEFESRYVIFSNPHRSTTYSDLLLALIDIVLPSVAGETCRYPGVV